MKVGGIRTSADKPDNHEGAFLGAVSEHTNKNDPWTVTLSLEGKPHIDTGAEVTIIAECMWNSVSQPALSPPERTLQEPDCHTIPRLTGTFTLGARQAEGEIYVVRRHSKPLLERPAIAIKRAASVSQEFSPKDQFPSPFHGIGKLVDEYTNQTS